MCVLTQIGDITEHVGWGEPADGAVAVDSDYDAGPTALDGLALRPDLSGDPSLRAATTGDLTADLCAAAIAALLRASARPGWPRFKACRGTGCHLVFIDNSRNTSRRRVTSVML